MSKLRGLRRTEFPVAVRKKAFARCCKDGVPHCESCGVALNARTGFIYEHLIPDGLGGEPTLENCGVWCRTCSDIKTFTEDNPRMEKADRILKAHHGLKRRKGPPMPGSRASGIKMKIGGGWEYRK